jgi:hypothetical protein
MRPVEEVLKWLWVKWRVIAIDEDFKALMDSNTSPWRFFESIIVEVVNGQWYVGVWRHDLKVKFSHKQNLQIFSGWKSSAPRPNCVLKYNVYLTFKQGKVRKKHHST